MNTGLHLRMSVAMSSEKKDCKSSVVELRGSPSAAFMESMRMAKKQSQRDEYAEDREDLLPEQREKIGWKTLLSAAFMLVTGLVIKCSPI
jgi:hypothetical protein